MSGNSILPASDRRSPFYINVPPHDAKPITYLISYFKLWKHFVASLIVYLKDLVKAKEFELNLNLQLIGSIQFPGFKDLPYKCLSSMEQQLPSPTTTQTSTPKNEPNASGAQQAAGLSKDANRPNLPKTKSSSSFLKNLSFAHRKTGSLSNLVPEGSATSVSSHHKQPANTKVSGSKTNAPQTTSSSILAAKLAPKSDVTIDSTFFPPDSLFTNMGSSLVKDHFSTYSAQAKLCREITHKLLPKLESLHKNIGVKIKEIKTSLKNESFANATLIKEVSKTGNCLTNFVNSVNRYSSPQPVIRRNDTEDEDEAVSLNDPFLVKLDLDYQIKNQLIHENYIFALYVNLQTISKDLFNYVVKDLHSVTEKLIKSLTSEAVYATTLENCLFNLGATLKGKLKSLDYDWQYFMVHNPNFLNVYYNDEKSPRKETRTFKDIVIPYSNSVHNKCLRCGYLHKKQKVMKSYVSHFYLLTCNYLHEFKVENHTEKAQKNESSNSSIRKKAKGKIGGVVDHESTPVKSYNLNDYSIQVRNEKEFKFVLTKTSNSSQKFTFKCQNETDFKAWSTDLHDLLKFSSQHIKRFNFIEAKMAHRDLDLNLGKLLPGDASLDKIQSSSLTGMFTPKIESPSNQNQNPFEAGFEQSLPLGGTPLENTNFVSSEHGSESPHAHSPLNSNSRAESPVDHQSEHEHYLRLQNEIMLQQEQLLLLGSAGGDRPSMSRHSSTESILSVMEQNNHNLSQFLNKNQDFMRDFGEHRPSDGSIALVPSVHVLHHEAD
ncbi:hypothetical protein METBIDRAFT_44421 [Metschnikowia bicuspidata var. bicuspidata NRRL YB-4993]|uniref:PH domain-containing protein n=1 Tax=Metschnikowia bicuspidata var. bicuspidata NRRL YB-4993 TaxID=869754 RepID=A0A1A0H7H3_9ASCO|nr:hypothetical protein METBIDRAFT_44421 [Metschnikowia bicuspidata var. bicuspidata NRRL YB-4993]OBA19976.1 hypothetical protein METBIDRAFT_44421 [Metschnikowia bicuspidata var. bicuspidata NRRL YB-4993]